MKRIIALLICGLFTGCAGLVPYAGLSSGAAFNHSGEDDFDGGTVGGRVGVWGPGESYQTGLLADVSGVFYDDLEYVPLSPMAAARMPGKLSPYVAAGPSLVFTSGDESSTDVGADIRIGVQLNIWERIKPFLEYRALYNDADLDGGSFAALSGVGAVAAKPGQGRGRGHEDSGGRGHDIGRGRGHDRDSDAGGVGDNGSTIRDRGNGDSDSARSIDDWNSVIMLGVNYTF